MAYLGIGYAGENPSFLRDFVEHHSDWLQGDRSPRFFGDAFVVLYDSNTAREFAKKCTEAAGARATVIYQLSRPL